jgi:hypothetical protein
LVAALLSSSSRLGQTLLLQMPPSYHQTLPSLRRWKGQGLTGRQVHRAGSAGSVADQGKSDGIEINAEAGR